MSAPAIGTVLAGRFRVDGAPIGEGATGVVVPAIDEGTGRPVAVKLLHDELVGDPGAVEALNAEVARASRLRHPHVLEVLGVWSEGGRAMLVTERASGKTLEDVLTRPLAPEAAMALVGQLADALSAAHAAGVVHGDVRAGNVLMGPRGALLFDFGVAAWAGGGRAGRPGETAPEVLDGGPPGTAADLYGLGVLLARALTGRVPFDGPTPWSRLGAQREGPVRIDGPRGLTRLVLELTRPDPTQRPGSMHRVLRALRRLDGRPHRRLRIPRPWLAPWRLRGAWVVHGTDPATGAPALVRAGLTRSRAQSLALRLTDEGWRVRAEKAGLSWADVGLAVAGGLLGGLVLPIVGALPAAWLVLRRRSRRARPWLPDVLPTAMAEVPPRRLSPGSEHAVVAGLLMLVSAFALWWGTWLAVLPIAALGWLGWISVRGRVFDPAAEASDARVRTALEDVRRLVGDHQLDLDRQLTLLGEVDAVEHAWRAGEIAADDALLTAERLAERARAGERAGLPAGHALDALRAAVVEGDDQP